MRTFSITLGLNGPRAGEMSALDKLQEVIRKWANTKLGSPQAAIKQYEFQEQTLDVDGGQGWRGTLSERSDDGGDWQTEISAAGRDSRSITLTVVMRVIPQAQVIAPIQYYVEPPSFVRLLAADFEISAGTFGLRSQCFPCTTPDDVDRLVELLEHPGRTLPVIVVSADGNPIPDLADRLARFLFGVAVVVEIGRDASFRLSDLIGKRMSVFDAGIRTYWPMWSRKNPPHRHPLILRDTVIASTIVEPGDPDGLIRTRLIQSIARASAARFEYPELVKAALRRRRDDGGGDEPTAELARLKQDLQEQKEIAEMAIAENAQYAEKIAELDKIIEKLRRKEDEDLDVTWEISSFDDLMSEARHQLSDVLLFSPDLTFDSTMTPALWYKVLEGLADACRAERRGEMKNKRAVIRDRVLAKASLKRDTYKVGETGVAVKHPETGEIVSLRERLHLKEGKPSETESVYWQTVGSTQSEYRYLIGKMGRHA